MPPLPTAAQLCPVPEDLDGRMVLEHLHGKAVAGAVALLKENSTLYAEDYTWMGPEALCYYAPALVDYLRSSAADGDFIFAYFMLSTFRLRVEGDGLAIQAAIPVMREFCEIIRSDAERLGFDDNYQRRAENRIRELEKAIAKLQTPS